MDDRERAQAWLDRTITGRATLPYHPALANLAAEFAAVRDEERERLSEALNRIREKCEQYWNENDIGIAEMHAVLEYIHVAARPAVPAPATPGSGEPAPETAP